MSKGKPKFRRGQVVACSFRRQVDKIHDTWQGCSNPRVEGETVCMEHLKPKLPDARFEEWAREFSQDSASDILDKFNLGQQAHIWRLMKKAYLAAANYSAQVEARARLAEAKLAPHESNCLMRNYDGSPTGLECSCRRGKRITQLESAARESGGQT